MRLRRHLEHMWPGLVTVIATISPGGCRTSLPTQLDERPVLALSGVSLEPPTLTDERRAELQADTAAAWARLQAEPDEEAFIWYGRRLAYEFRYRAAIDVFSAGLERYPDSFKLRRHRGHRFITVREFEHAVTDLSEAAALANGLPDELEPDGAPNRFGIPTSTNQSNIAYHLGLALYLLGRFDEALVAYERGLDYATVNNDMHVAMAWWTYLTRRRLGAQADDVLAAIDADMPILENHAYLQLLLMAKGEAQVDELLASAEQGIAGATLRGGIASYLLANGQPERAILLFRELSADAQWMAFGHITAEAELQRLDDS